MAVQSPQPMLETSPLAPTLPGKTQAYDHKHSSAPVVRQPPWITFNNTYTLPNPLYGLYTVRAKFLVEHPECILEHEHRLVAAYVHEAEKTKRLEILDGRFACGDMAIFTFALCCIVALVLAIAVGGSSVQLEGVAKLWVIG